MNNDDVISKINSIQLAQFLYQSLDRLMKTTLDLGTLASENPHKLRAYKEQVKRNFKQQWIDIAQVFEAEGIITPCSCNEKDFCTICKGSRYLMDEAFDPSDSLELANSPAEANLKTKLQRGLIKAYREMMEN